MGPPPAVGAGTPSSTAVMGPRQTERPCGKFPLPGSTCPVLPGCFVGSPVVGSNSRGAVIGRGRPGGPTPGRLQVVARGPPRVSTVPAARRVNRAGGPVPVPPGVPPGGPVPVPPGVPPGPEPPGPAGLSGLSRVRQPISGPGMFRVPAVALGLGRREGLHAGPSGGLDRRGGPGWHSAVTRRWPAEVPFGRDPRRTTGQAGMMGRRGITSSSLQLGGRPGGARSRPSNPPGQAGIVGTPAAREVKDRNPPMAGRRPRAGVAPVAHEGGRSRILEEKKARTGSGVNDPGPFQEGTPAHPPEDALP